MLVELRDGLRLHASVRGSGDALLLIHGFTGSATAWGEPVLRALARTHRLVAVDVLGHGGSDGPTDPRRYALPPVLADLLEVLDHFGIARAHWLGYSMGGRLALAAAVEHPARVLRLVVESASPGLRTERQRAARRESDRDVASRLREGGLPDFVDRWTRQPLFEPFRRNDPEAWRAARARRLTNRADALAACLEGLGTGSQPSYWNDLPRVEAPALILVGGEDRKFREIGAEMTALLRRATLRVIEGSGHVVHAERTSEWLGAVRDFLGAPGEAPRDASP